MAIRQISVFMENRAGELARITAVLAAHHIDMRAINVAEGIDYGVLRMIVNDSQKGCEILLNEGFIASLTQVTAVCVPDCPGGLASLLKIFADAMVDVQYMYSYFGQLESQAIMVIRVSDADYERLRALLEEKQIHVVKENELGIC